MSVKGFTFGSDPTIQKYDYEALDNKPDIEGIESDITNERLARQEADLEFEEAIHDLSDTKASIDGTYPSMAVGSLLGTEVEDKVPYLFRPTGGGVSVGDREYDEIVGGTVGWNQMCNGASVTVANGRKYLSKIGSTWAVGASTGSAITGLTAGSDMVIDLTALFGSTIADYIYSLEQATAGAGVAWFRQYFGKDYYPYSAPTLKSVEGLTAHVMRDADNNIVGNYPLDSSWVGRGILKLDSNNKLYFDGDRYSADGTVTRRYGIVDLGTLNWTYDSSRFFANIPDLSAKTVRTVQMICAKYVALINGEPYPSEGDKAIYGGGQNNVYVHDPAYTDAATFKTAMSGVYLVYELATPTAETADPYEQAQICDPNGTEQYVTNSIVPVGHNTQYPENLADKISNLPSLPTEAGEYKLKVTISSGKVTYTWVSA